MSATKRVMDIGGLFALVCGLVYALRPDMYLLFDVGCGVFLATMIYAAVRATPADVERVRREAWLVPVATLLMGAYIVFSAAPEERTRAWLAAGALAVLGFGMFALRRRVT